MNTIWGRAAAVSGARHLRMARNGQDAAASWVGEGAGAIVVCDGCGSSASSEVGARLGAQLVIAAVAARLLAGERPSALWPGVRAQVASVLRQLADAMPGGRAAAIREHFLFTIVAAAAAGDEACVWAIGDGAFACADGGAARGGAARGGAARGGAARGVITLGPFEDNRPPYLAYDLLDMPQPARLETLDAAAGGVAVATDGVAEIGLARLLDDASLGHADGLRRRLAVLARAGERIDWEARRVVRTPAALQDDGAVAVLRWQP
jgi:hypothetical protein